MESHQQSTSTFNTELSCMESSESQPIVTRKYLYYNDYRGFVAIIRQKAYFYDVNCEKMYYLQDMKCDYFGRSAASCNEEVFAISGLNTNSVEKISWRELSSGWVEVASTNECRSAAASVACDNFIYTIGGWPLASSGERYDYYRNTWSNIKNMNEERQNHALVAVKGQIYAFGGYKDSNGKGYKITVTNTAECYDPRSNDWTMIPPMRTRRYGLAAVVLYGKIYVIGGCDEGRNNLASVERYNPVSGKWKKVASLNHPRSFHGACVITAKIYVAGGESYTIEVYDHVRDVWTVERNFGVLEDARHIVVF